MGRPTIRAAHKSHPYCNSNIRIAYKRFGRVSLICSKELKSSVTLSWTPLSEPNQTLISTLESAARPHSRPRTLSTAGAQQAVDSFHGELTKRPSQIALRTQQKWDSSPGGGAAPRPARPARRPGGVRAGGAPGWRTIARRWTQPDYLLAD
ncbi:hypothetical protein EVAR_38794_1 [Eumeta japonica]|uniref:Uncharacterized protein n=1 Tax=Eumeta variegata TaxID=151549 RepID=A0A4C1WKM2_EUMVA|nr:hypothetical protein EVAR_38794_1 [Eumeta japonica]